MKNPHQLPQDPVLAAWRVQLKTAAEKPWLASLLLRQGQRLFRRFAHFYQRLRALPRQKRRALAGKLRMTLAGLALALSQAPVPAAHAQTITVNGDGSGGTCSLVDAITAANTNTATGNCPAGDDAGGYDTRVLNLAHI